MDGHPSGPRWNEGFSSPPSGWGRSPYRGPIHRGGSGRGYHGNSPNSPPFSPGFNRGQRGGSPYRSGGGRRSFGGSPAMSGSGGRYYGEKPRGRNSFGSPSNFTPASNQRETSESIERYFSPSMLEDPWAALLPKQTETSNDSKP